MNIVGSKKIPPLSEFVQFCLPPPPAKIGHHLSTFPNLKPHNQDIFYDNREGSDGCIVAVLALFGQAVIARFLDIKQLKNFIKQVHWSMNFEPIKSSEQPYQV